VLIMIEEVPEVMIEVDLNYVLVEGTVESLAKLGIKGKQQEDPVTGRACTWITATDLAAIQAVGLTSWDAAEYLFFMLQTVIEPMAPLFLDIDTTRYLVETVEQMVPELVSQTVPATVSWFELTDVLRRLVAEEISIGDMERILKALSQCEPILHDTVLLTERVRHALSRQITEKFIRDKNSLTVFLLDSEIEELINRSIQHISSGSYLDLDPEYTQRILAAVRWYMSSVGVSIDDILLLVTVAEIRLYMRKLVELEFPSLHVLSRQDLETGTPIQIVATIHLDHHSDYETRPTQERHYERA